MSVSRRQTAPFIWASVRALKHLRSEWKTDKVRAGIGLSVYHALCELANEDYARTAIGSDSGAYRTSRARIAERACVSVRSVDGACQELERIGLLEVARDQGDDKQKPGRISSYILLEPVDETCADSSHVDAQRAQTLRTTKEEQQENSVGSSPPNTPPSRKSQAEAVGAFYVETMKPRSKQLAADDLRIIEEALKVATLQELERCIETCARSDYHMKRGKHTARRGGRYCSLGHIFKPRTTKGQTWRSRIDWWLDRYEENGATTDEFGWTPEERR